MHEYLLIGQDAYHIEHYVRQEDNRWLLSEANAPDAVIHLPSIAWLSLADAYEKVILEDG